MPVCLQGYREAQMAFFEAPLVGVSLDTASKADASGAKTGSMPLLQQKQTAMCLAILAPRREIVEVSAGYNCHHSTVSTV